jgi:ribosome-associated protein
MAIEDELALSFSRSSGPGGQHVNTSATKVELRFDVAGSPSLSAAQKARVSERLGNRLTADGVLILTSSEHRSQTRNREAVVARFRTLLADALAPPPPPRRLTRPTAAARRRRAEHKRRQSQRKALRRPIDPES